MVDSSTSTHRVSNGATYWFTGLSGAGKSTLSGALKVKLDSMVGDSKKVFILDGDVIRQGLNKDLGFSAEDRKENIRRISEVSKLFCMAGQIVFVAFISPYAADREFARNVHREAGLNFYECHISATLEVCEGRDVKGLYKKARAGIIPKFTGVSDPYEAPESPEMNINTGEQTLEQSCAFVLNQMYKENILTPNASPVVADSLIKSLSEDAQKEVDGLKFIDINKEQAEYIQTIGQGWAYPLKRFMNELELLESMHMNTITDAEGKRHLMSVPMTQDVSAEQKAELANEKRIAIKCTEVSNDVLAVINNPVFFDNRKEEISTRTFGTSGLKHPKVDRIMKQGDFLISGESMDFVREVAFNDGIDSYRMTPQQVSEQIKAKNADAVYAFQVRNPLHNGHVLLLKDTREQLLKLGYKNPILLLHPLGGWCKDDDVPLDTRMKQH